MSERSRARQRAGPDAGRRGTLLTEAPLIGLIGPIGCGKSTVAGWLRQRGAAIVDADLLTRALMVPGAPVTEAVIGHFGEEYRRPDGSLDRTALGRLVFSDSQRLAELEAIVHPAVAGVLEATIREADSRRPTAIVLEAVKLVEAGHAGWCDEVWLVACDADTQLARLTGRGMAAADACQRIEAQQSSMAVWRSAATRVVDVDAGPATVEARVDSALREVLSRRE